MHFFRLPARFPCIPSLQLKFSSQNSANQTFLLLLDRERLRKYRSNAGERKKNQAVRPGHAPPPLPPTQPHRSVSGSVSGRA